MTVEVFGHVKGIEHGCSPHGLRLYIKLEMDRANGQLLELSVTPEEARTYMPGTGITLRLFPNALKPCPPEFKSSDEVKPQDAKPL